MPGFYLPSSFIMFSKLVRNLFPSTGVATEMGNTLSVTMEISAVERLRHVFPMIVIIFLLGMVGCTSTVKPVDSKIDGVEKEPTLEERWGIQIVGIRMSAGNYMVDFRYRVTDVEKAAPLFDGRIKPYLLDQATGEKLFVPTMPKVGSLRATHLPIADRTYYMIFGNMNRRVKEGSKVTVVIGDFRAENLVVE
jgi:hypothetical protein